MIVMPTPTMANGKICYIEMPTTDIARSSAFYESVFGWKIRRRGDGSIAFDDGVGEVSGTWVTGRPPSHQPGLLIYILVDRVETTIETILAHRWRDRSADWRGCTRDHRTVSRSWRQCAR